MSLAEIKEAVEALSPISQSWLSSFASVKTWHGTTRSLEEVRENIRAGKLQDLP